MKYKETKEKTIGKVSELEPVVRPDKKRDGDEDEDVF
jgi:hypothetical protein